MKNLTTLLTAALFLVLTACGGGQSGSSQSDGGSRDSAGNKQKKEGNMEDETSSDMPDNAMQKNGLTVYPIETKDYPDAKLSLNKPGASDVDPGTFQFDFAVDNYELKKGTPDADKHGLAESSKGQHIHFIVNNGPYQAKYKSSFEATMDEPGYYTVFSFLSRSYHESVKNPNAFVIKQFKVGDPEEGMQADLSKPHLFYSRPKGTYAQGDYDKLLLDFYPVNVDTMGENGYKVKATVNDTTAFTFTEHKPYVIEGLEAGEVSVKLQLMDENGELVDSKYNEVTRNVTLRGSMDSNGEMESGKEQSNGDVKSSSEAG
jgi:hypothetical protein